MEVFEHLWIEGLVAERTEKPLLGPLLDALGMEIVSAVAREW